MTAPMKPTEMWAVVDGGDRPTAIAPYKRDAIAEAGALWHGGWRQARKYGWRVVRVLVTEVPRPDGKEGG